MNINIIVAYCKNKGIGMKMNCLGKLKKILLNFEN